MKSRTNATMMTKNTDPGTPNTVPFPITENCSGSGYTGTPFVRPLQIPLAMYMVPRVTINAGILTRTIRVPLNSPTRDATTMDATTATGIGSPILRNMATAIPLTPITEPTDRSIPPTMITIVMNMAMITT